MARNQLSEAGRLRCSESGKRNVVPLNENKAALRRELATLAQDTQAGLLGALGPNVTAAQRIVVRSLVASALAFNAISARLERGRGGLGFLSDLIRLQSEARRSLVALGLIAAVADEPGERAGAAPSITALQAEYAARRQGEPK